MPEPVYFVVELFQGREIPSVVRRAPPNPKYVWHPIIASVRLDELPNFAALMTLSTRQLHALWKNGALSE